MFWHHRALVFTALLAVPFTALGQEQTDVLGGQGNSNTGSGSYKLDFIEVGQTVQLDLIEFYLEPEQGDTEVHFVVYENGQSAEWEILYDSGPQVLSNGEGFKGSPAVNTLLEAGEEYLLGVFIPLYQDVTYWWGNAGVNNLGWGLSDGARFSTNGSVPQGQPPSTIEWWEGDWSDTAYHARITVSFGEDLDGDGAGSFSDCDDTNATIYPGADELCDEIDNDCDDQIDEDVVYVDYFQDSDEDGFGDSDISETACDGQPDGFTDRGQDCDDTNGAVYPGADEVCDGVDNDCDGELLPDESVDADGDGSPVCADCNDEDALVFPGADDPCNGIDNDCDGTIPEGDTCDPYADEALIGSGCACAQPGSTSGAGWLLALGWLAARRRRR